MCAVVFWLYQFSGHVSAAGPSIRMLEFGGPPGRPALISSINEAHVWWVSPSAYAHRLPSAPFTVQVSHGQNVN